MKQNKIDKVDGNFPMVKVNYLMLIVGFIIIIIGFSLMVGGRTGDPSKFSNEIFSFRRITLAPIIVLLGFAIEIWAIMKKPPKETPSEQ